VSLKKTDLEKLLGKKIAGSAGARGDRGMAMTRREQARARKRELLEKDRRSK
jgi:hypothetical protein